jgi:transcriptional regulator with XRE-family HTH domain
LIYRHTLRRRNCMRISGNKLRQLREKRLLSLRELAARADLTPATIHHIECGKTKLPRGRTVRQLAEALDVPPARLRN